MTRPSFQFYPKDWRNNANLRRCSAAARGIWMDVLCVLHDSDEYGLVRWPLKDLANAAGAPIGLVRELVEKSVLKGIDKGDAEPYIYIPRSGRRDGAPVTLVPTQPGPLWYSSRMVKDEYVRTTSGASTRFGADKPITTKGQSDSPNHSPTRRHGEWRGEDQSDGSSSSSSSSTPVLNSVPIGTEPPDGSSAAAEPTMTALERRKSEAWKGAKSLLNAHGMPKAQTGTFVGKLVTDYGAETVLDVLESAVLQRPAEPDAWIVAACKRNAGQRQRPNKQEALEQRNRAVAAEWVAEMQAKERANATV